MKKAFALLLTLCLLLSLAACGEPEETKDPGKEPGASQTSSIQQEEVGTKTIYVLAKKTQTQIIDGKVTDVTTMENIYDENGLLVQQVYTYDDGSPDSVLTAENDAFGRVIRLTRTTEGGDSVIEYTYDDAGNLLSEIRSFAGTVFFSDVRTYDEAGNMLSCEMRFTDGETNKYQYIYENGRLVKTELYKNGELSQYFVYIYDDQGRIATEEIRYENDALWATNVYTYSEDGRTTYVDCKKYRLQSIEVVDENGNLIRTESIDAGGSTVTEYTYIAVEVPADCPRKN